MLSESYFHHRFIDLLEVLSIIDICSFIHATLLEKCVSRWLFSLVLLRGSEGIERVKGSLVGRN